MLSPEETFPLYAELALALAGFAGVVSAFKGRDRVFRPTERIRFVAVVMASACVLLGCFTILAALAGDFSLPTSYRTSGALCFAASAVYTLRTFPAAWRRSRDPDSTTERWSFLVSLAVHFGEGGFYVLKRHRDGISVAPCTRCDMFAVLR
ncbi:MAG: hypothetical protein AAF471_08260, partial [Myxococcota bacterium]